jgi:hypothetical protein
MEHFSALVCTHLEGEQTEALIQAGQRWPLETLGGGFYAEWDMQAPVTREGQLIFFFQFLHQGARWSEFMRECPLHYTGNHGSGSHNVMGTLLLSILCGHWRHAHINAVRGDKLNAEQLGLSHIVSEDAVRAALKRMDEPASLSWLQQQILQSISPALHLPWILDIDTTIKALYGHQEGAPLGYHPQKSLDAPAMCITATSWLTFASA